MKGDYLLLITDIFKLNGTFPLRSSFEYINFNFFIQGIISGYDVWIKM